MIIGKRKFTIHFLTCTLILGAGFPTISCAIFKSMASEITAMLYNPNSDLSQAMQSARQNGIACAIASKLDKNTEPLELELLKKTLSTNGPWQPGLKPLEKLNLSASVGLKTKSFKNNDLKACTLTALNVFSNKVIEKKLDTAFVDNLAETISKNPNNFAELLDTPLPSQNTIKNLNQCLSKLNATESVALPYSLISHILSSINKHLQPGIINKSKDVEIKDGREATINFAMPLQQSVGIFFQPGWAQATEAINMLSNLIGSALDATAQSFFQFPAEAFLQVLTTTLTTHRLKKGSFLQKNAMNIVVVGSHLFNVLGHLLRFKITHSSIKHHLNERLIKWNLYALEHRETIKVITKGSNKNHMYNQLKEHITKSLKAQEDNYKKLPQKLVYTAQKMMKQQHTIIKKAILIPTLGLIAIAISPVLIELGLMLHNKIKPQNQLSLFNLIR
ncbi:hypothetical protein KAU11_02440 [Candidatus Babeliales bacterium]|nr:hypothetical protein [Candidatus Babeliales bacterium]